MIPLLLIRVGTGAAAAIILAESFEYTAEGARSHFGAPVERAHYAAGERAHYVAVDKYHYEAGERLHYAA